MVSSSLWLADRAVESLQAAARRRAACAATIVETPLNQLHFLERRDQRRRVRRAGGAPADLRCGARADRRGARIPGARLLPVQQPARRARSTRKPHRELSVELRDALLARKRALPQLHVLVIADPINDVYGGLPSRDLAALRDAGIDVVTRRPRRAARFEPYLLRVLAADDALVVGRRLAARPALPNPLDAGPDQVSFGAWARLLNFKANHRKVIIGDDGKGGITGIVTSANPHDASSLHSNVGAASCPARRCCRLLESELALAARCGLAAATGSCRELPRPRAIASPETTARVQVLTEGEIGAAIVRNFAGARVGDSIDIAMFYLSERSVIQALLAAAKRGVAVRVHPRSQQGRIRPHQERHSQPLGGHRARRGLRRRHQGALVPHARRAVPQQAGRDAHRRRNSGSRWVRPISRAATSTTSISKPTSPRACR